MIQLSIIIHIFANGVDNNHPGRKKRNTTNLWRKTEISLSKKKQTGE